VHRCQESPGERHRDGACQLDRVAHPGATGTVRFTYDAFGNRRAMADSDESTTYTYDLRNRLMGVATPVNHMMGYGYDAAGNRSSISYPGATGTVSYAYDAAERLQSVTD